ncbi:hypothetical protein F5880DRAFT_1537760 [Lentinula raphanica]|nr:hypothetical protein F5880DRAFT_1537760 [Lentinula raphanica]
MANTDQDPSISSEPSEQEVKKLEGPINAVQSISQGSSAASSSSSGPASGSLSDIMDSKGSPAISLSNTSHPRPTLVQLGSNGTPTAQPKKYNASNINKKFLEKNSTSLAIASTPGFGSARLAGGVRPSPSSSSPHPRLVTTKLTATAQLAPSPGPGWSRSSSVTPPVSASIASAPNGTSSLAPTSSQTTVSVPAAPQLPHAGKVIQPQPRSLGSGQTVHREGGHAVGPGQGKSAWGNVNPVGATSATRADARTQSDFPTAAEVAQSRSKSKSRKDAELEAEVANKQARMEEADTFRGVHLDPNAHHWDEMEEDDDNFLDGVIEFGDGRQYKIDTNDDSVPLSAPIQVTSREQIDSSQDQSEPVRKEDRFADDFDRSWPRTKKTPTSDFVPAPGPRAPQSVSPSTSQSAHSPLEPSRVLFNERSNRLEPYNNSRESGRPNQGSEPRFVRNPAPATFAVSSNNIQLLQKPPSGENSHRGPGYHGAVDQQRDYEPSRREIPPGPQLQPYQPRPKPRRGSGPFPSNSFERDPPPDHRGRRLSNMGPPPVPPHVMNRTSSFRDHARQVPPHLANGPPTTPTSEHRQSSRDSRYSARPPSSTGHSSARYPSQSPVLSHAVPTASPVMITSERPITSSASTPQVSAAELEDVAKGYMQDAAARAKQRRQQEEEQREKEKERARQKAAELEARLAVERAEKERAEKEREEREREEKEREEKERLEKERVEKEKVTVQEEKVTNEEVEVSAQPQSTMESQDAKVSNVIQEAVSSVQHKPPSSERPTGVSFGKPPLRRLSTHRIPFIPSQDASRPPFARKSSSIPSLTPSTPSGTAESWRTGRQPAQAPQQPSQSLSQSPTQPSPATIERPRAVSFATPPPSALDQVELSTDLEVVDYSDLAKFIGVAEITEEITGTTEEKQTEEIEPAMTSTAATPSKLRRPVASDFFGEESSPAVNSSKEHTRSDTGASTSDNVTSPSQVDVTTTDDVTPQVETTTVDVVVSLPPPVDHSSVPATVHTSPNHPRRSQYKEATMSALDDTISRIKGALDVMHEKDHKPVSEPEQTPRRSLVPSSSSPYNKWVPPAFREPRPTEPFANTCPEPPRSPRVWNVFTVNLPTVSTPRSSIPPKQMAMFNKTEHVRWDILSFEPSVEGMKRREFTVTDVLFRKPYAYGGYKGKPKYPVRLPESSLRVNLPSQTQSATARPPAGGAFGKSAGADGASTWRKSSTHTAGKIDLEPSFELDTTSRSPPPEPEAILSRPKKEVIAESDIDSESESQDTSIAPVRSRAQPKMPAGSGVAFYRNSHVLTKESGSKPSVSFFATNELEIPSSTSREDVQTVSTSQDLLAEPVSTTNTQQSPSSSNAKQLVVRSSPTTSQYGLPSLIPSGKAESKSSDDSPDRVPLTPPAHHTSPWVRSSLGLVVKESPGRGPDPEHLKAVWSQTSNQPGLHPVNSLDGITDDLPSVPFTIQDVKSEDGETPPPTTIAPSRMSLHDVTRAFQQVPSPSNIPQHRPTISPPSTTAPVARPTPSYSYHPPPIQPPNQNVRPQYPFHPSPMMTHSPAPNAMYTHPNPLSNRMQVNGQTPMYSPPVWVPLQNPNAQSSPMMRPMTASYPSPTMMPYHPSPGAPQPMYALPPPPPNMPPPQQNGTPTRGRAMSMMSPAISHAVPAMPMYPGSPGMMPVHVGRGNGAPARNDAHPTLQHHQPPPHHQPQSYAPPPTNSFIGARPTW